MTITLPDEPRLANDSERKVWQQLGEHDLIIAGHRVTDHLKDHEIDFVVVIDGAGIVCVEVKGGEVWHDGQQWWQQSRGGPLKTNEPVRQARDACYARVNSSRPTPARARAASVGTTSSSCPIRQSRRSLRARIVRAGKWSNRDDLFTLVARLRDMIVRHEIDRPYLTDIGIEQLQTALSGRGLPQRDVVARALENEDAADILTESHVSSQNSEGA